MKSNLEIAQTTKMKSIATVAKEIGLTNEDIILYGNDKAKIKNEVLASKLEKKDGKLILVTSLNPTPAGEGKSTVTIGLTDGLNALDHQTIAALREPSMGPVLAADGIGAGGGYAQALPLESINLHFTGDIHAVTSANNLLASLIDNHLHHGNELNLDPRRIAWKRVLDLNDRSLRQITIGLGGTSNSIPREETVEITVASEIMAVFCLAKDYEDLHKRLGNMIIGYTYAGDPLSVTDLGAEGVLTLLLKEAFQPNLVQTVAGNPVLIHGSTFANIAHGSNSLVATKLGLKLADFVVTEAGFGADLGAEKFLDIKVPLLEKSPDAIVMVATLRALKIHGGVPLAETSAENSEALVAGFENLKKHIQNMEKYGLPVIVAINEFMSDTDKEIQQLIALCEEIDVPVEIITSYTDGTKGSLALAQRVLDVVAEGGHEFEAVYSFGMTIEEKITAIVTEIYGGSSVIFSEKTKQQIALFKKYGWDRLPICMAKTEYSLSDDPLKIGRPQDFVVSVRELTPMMGGSFIVAYTGEISTMPSLPAEPVALNMKLNQDGDAQGLN